jgi:integrase
LKWSDVDFERATATIQRTLQWRKKRKDSQAAKEKSDSSWYFDKPKTKRSRRTVPLPAGLVQQLREHRATQAEALLKIGVRSELVFANSEGTPLHWQNVTKRHFKPVLEKAGLPASFRLYDLRHSCATLLLQDGLNPKIVSERLGHASIVLTLDTYSHVLPDMQSEAAESLQRRFYG